MERCKTDDKLLRLHQDYRNAGIQAVKLGVVPFESLSAARMHDLRRASRDTLCISAMCTLYVLIICCKERIQRSGMFCARFDIVIEYP